MSAERQHAQHRSDCGAVKCLASRQFSSSPPWLDVRLLFLTLFSRKAYRNAY
jgi:hypothetical protein